MPTISERQAFLREIDSSLRHMSILWDDEETDDFEELLDIKFCVNQIDISISVNIQIIKIVQCKTVFLNFQKKISSNL